MHVIDFNSSFPGSEMGSSFTGFINAALLATGDKALSYSHDNVRWLIREHLLSLLHDFPTLSPASGLFTHGDGAAAHLLHAHGLLPISPSMPPVLVTIWLPQAYPFMAPAVYVFPINPSQTIPYDHPFVDPSGASTSPYLDAWQFSKSNLSDLARSLVWLFRFCHPYGWESPVCPATRHASKREAVDRLAANLHRDVNRFRAEVGVDIHQLCRTQSVLRERAAAIDSGMRELERERLGLRRALEEKASDADVVANWVRLHRGGDASSLGEMDGFEAAGERERCLVENEAAVRAIDDAMVVLDEAMTAGVVEFGAYIKQVRCWAREQFFHKAIAMAAAYPRAWEACPTEA